jgi:hypothetical protein
MRQAVDAAWDKAKRFLFRRQICYRQVFNLQSQAAVVVLEDLAKFCRAHDSTFHPNDSAQSMMAGRREVWLRIQNHLKLSSDDLWQLHSSVAHKQGE